MPISFQLTPSSLCSTGSSSAPCQPAGCVLCSSHLWGRWLLASPLWSSAALDPSPGLIAAWLVTTKPCQLNEGWDLARFFSLPPARTKTGPHKDDRLRTQMCNILFFTHSVVFVVFHYTSTNRSLTDLKSNTIFLLFTDSIHEHSVHWSRHTVCLILRCLYYCGHQH